jgi:hypothetical protein
MLVIRSPKQPHPLPKFATYFIELGKSTLCVYMLSIQAAGLCIRKSRVPVIRSKSEVAFEP